MELDSIQVKRAMLTLNSVDLVMLILMIMKIYGSVRV
jgi:hypothetical protein